MTLKDLQGQTNEWIERHGVKYFDEMTNMVILMEEVGEFARLMARIHGQQSFKEEIDPRDYSSMLSDELADILFVITCLANQMDIDLTDAMQVNMTKKTIRDVDRHKSNKKLKE